MEELDAARKRVVEVAKRQSPVKRNLQGQRGEEGPSPRSPRSPRAAQQEMAMLRESKANLEDELMEGILNPNP